MSATFKKAERRQVHLKLALTGPSGSGKTLSALLIARGIVGPAGRIALVDTENKSAALYVAHPDHPEIGDFDTLEIDPPYTVAKYVEAIKAAQAAKYDILVLDSITHAWAGEGGLLSKKEALDARGGNSYVNWGSITKEHETFKAMLLQADVHLIATMRSKQDYVLEQDKDGKAKPKKVGMAPIQRDGMEYEFTTVLDMGMDHNAAASKDRTGLFDRQFFTPTVETGQKLLGWLMSGAPIPAPAASPPAPAARTVAGPPSVESTKGEPGFVTTHIAEVKAFKDGHFEVLDVEGVIYVTRSQAMAKTIKDEAAGTVLQVTLEYFTTEANGKLTRTLDKVSFGGAEAAANGAKPAGALL